jgi:MtN3 and saliva related transmembrane protein
VSPIAGGHAVRRALRIPRGRQVTRERLGWALRLLCFLSIITLYGCEGLSVTDAKSLLIPRFTRSEILGLVAGFGTTFAAVPDLIAMLRRRSSLGMNPRMAAIMDAFQILWIYYGLLIASRPVVLWNLIAVLTNSFSVGAYFYYARRERRKALKGVQSGPRDRPASGTG